MAIATPHLAQLPFKVSRLCADSRKLLAGDTFVAYPGEKSDGRTFIPQAIARGASAVLWEPANFKWQDDWAIANQPLPQLREKLGFLANEVYGLPSHYLWVIGVTGTNGKTSCAHWLGQALTKLGRKTAIIGTLGNGFYGELAPTANTTPDAITLHAQLRAFLEQGARAVAMEVSSHGLVQGRVNGVAFDVAILTNLSRDHLDFHGSMQAYENAKAMLFSWPELRYAILNRDDALGLKLSQHLNSDAKIITYGIAEGDVHCAALQVNAQGIKFDAVTPQGRAPIASQLLGAFNVYNLLATLSALLASGIDLQSAARALAQLEPVPGRMQKIGAASQALVVIDYAHTPDALEKVLISLKELLPASGRLICVFGCGGERDHGKRPMMGEVATRLASLTIVTSDNPRGENPRAIIDEIIGGTTGEYRIIEDRAQAIQQAIQLANSNDIVLIAGKGHESYQEIAGVKLPFDDASVAKTALERGVAL